MRSGTSSSNAKAAGPEFAPDPVRNGAGAFVESDGPGSSRFWSWGSAPDPEPNTGA